LGELGPISYENRVLDCIAAANQETVTPVTSHRGEIECIQKRYAIRSPSIAVPVLDRALDIAPLIRAPPMIRSRRRTIGLGWEICHCRACGYEQLLQAEYRLNGKLFVVVARSSDRRRRVRRSRPIRWNTRRRAGVLRGLPQSRSASSCRAAPPCGCTGNGPLPNQSGPSTNWLSWAQSVDPVRGWIASPGLRGPVLGGALQDPQAL
jgi:hypothetical protein